MKKTVFAMALASLALSTSAFANVYVQGDLGYSRTKIEDVKKNRFEPRLSVGYKLQDFRLALDYTHYADIKESYYFTDGQGTEKLKIYGVGLSAIYDIPVQSALKPYVGVRVALNRLKYTDNWVATNASAGVTSQAQDSYSKTSFGYGAIVGVNYPLLQNLKLNAGLEYNHLGSIFDSNVKNYGVKVGLRYDF